MNKYFFIKLAILSLFIIVNINCCNYVSISANKEKCDKSSKDDPKKTCCYVKIKKNGYTMDFCAEIINKPNDIKQYKDQMKTINGLSSIKVECRSTFISNSIYIVISLGLLFFL